MNLGMFPSFPKPHQPPLRVFTLPSKTMIQFWGNDGPTVCSPPQLLRVRSDSWGPLTQGRNDSRFRIETWTEEQWLLISWEAHSLQRPVLWTALQMYPNLTAMKIIYTRGGRWSQVTFEIELHDSQTFRSSPMIPQILRPPRKTLFPCPLNSLQPCAGLRGLSLK